MQEGDLESSEGAVCDEEVAAQHVGEKPFFFPALPKTVLLCENLTGVDTLSLELLLELADASRVDSAQVRKLVVSASASIRSLSDDIFATLTGLEEVDLRGHRLASIPHTIENCVNLRVLRLDGNRLTFLPSTLKQCRNLQELSVSQNLLKSFNPNLFENLTNLQILAADNNSLVTIPSTICRASRLRTINLRNNPLRTIPPNLFVIPTLVQVSIDWIRFCAPPLPRKITGQDLRQVVQTLTERLSDEALVSEAIVKAGYSPERFGFNYHHSTPLLRTRREKENDPDRNASQTDPGTFRWPEQLPCFATIVLLSRRSVRVSAVDKSGRTRLHVASAEGNVGMVDALLRAGAATDALDEQNFSPLLHAVRGENWQCAERLLRGGARPDYGGGVFGSSLHVAAVNTDVEITALLLKYGADPNFEDRDGNTPLHVLFSVFDSGGDRSVAIALLLLMRGAKCNVKGQDGWAPLHLAARRNQIHAFGFVSDCQALARRQAFMNLPMSRRSLAKCSNFDINLRGGQQAWTPLHLAAHAGLSRIVVKLVDMGANVLALNSSLKTPRDVASGQLETTKALLRAERQWLFWKVCGARRPLTACVSPHQTPMSSSDDEGRYVPQPSAKKHLSLQLAESLLTPRHCESSVSGARFLHFARLPPKSLSRYAPPSSPFYTVQEDDDMIVSPSEDLRKLSLDLASFIDPFMPLHTDEATHKQITLQAQHDMAAAETRFFRACLNFTLKDPLGLGPRFPRDGEEIQPASPVILPANLLVVPPTEPTHPGAPAPLTARTARVVRASVAVQEIADPSAVRNDFWDKSRPIKGVTRLRNKSIQKPSSTSSVLRLADNRNRSSSNIPHGVAQLLRSMAIIHVATTKVSWDRPELQRLKQFRLCRVPEHSGPPSQHHILESLSILNGETPWRSRAIVPLQARLFRLGVWLIQVIGCLCLSADKFTTNSEPKPVRPNVPMLALGGNRVMRNLNTEPGWPIVIAEVLISLANANMEDDFVYLLASMPLATRAKLCGLRDSYGCSVVSRLLQMSSEQADRFCRMFLHLCPNLAEFLDKTDANDANRGPLHIAAKRGLLQSTQLLLLRGADVNLKDATGNTPLHLSVWFHQPCVALTLLYHPKIDVSATDSIGRTPLDLAVEVGEPQFVSMLINRGAGIPLTPSANLPSQRNPLAMPGLGDLRLSQSITGRATQVHDTRLSAFLTQMLIHNGVEPTQLSTFEMLRVNALADRCLKPDPRPLHCVLYLGMPLGPATACRVRGTSTHKTSTQPAWTITRTPITPLEDEDFVPVHGGSSTRCLFPEGLGTVCLFCSAAYWHSSVVGTARSAVSPRVIKRRPSTSKRSKQQFQLAVVTCRSCGIPLCERCVVMASRITSGSFPLLEDLPRAEKALLLLQTHPGAAHEVYRPRHSVGTPSLNCGIAGRRYSATTGCRGVPRLIGCRRGSFQARATEPLDEAIDRAIADAPEDVLVVLGIAQGNRSQVDLDIEWDDSIEELNSWGSMGGLAKSGLRFESLSCIEDWTSVILGLKSSYRRLAVEPEKAPNGSRLLGLCTPRLGQVRRPRPPSRRMTAEATTLQGVLAAAEAGPQTDVAREPLTLCATCACFHLSLPLRFPLKIDTHKKPHIFSGIDTGSALTFRYRRQLRTDGAVSDQVIPVATL